MTREEVKIYFEQCNNNIISVCKDENKYDYEKQEIISDCARKTYEANRLAIEALEQEPYYNPDEWCHDCSEYDHKKHCCPRHNKVIRNAVKEIKQSKTGHCKDCKWWKDSDGAYRRGIGAESKCPINRREVFEGNGYCYMYEPQESEEA